MKRTLLLVRPTHRQAADIAVCAQNGWIALPFAPIALQVDEIQCTQLPQKLNHAHAVFWVSPSAVEIAIPYLSDKYQRIIHIAVGRATALALQNHNIQAHHHSTGNDSEAALTLPIWAQLPPNARILIVRGHGGREILANSLRQRGFVVDYAEIYRREILPLNWADFERVQPIAAWVTSSQMAQQLFAQCPPKLAQNLQSLLYFTHHQRIADALHQLGASRVHIIVTLADAFHNQYWG